MGVGIGRQLCRISTNRPLTADSQKARKSGRFAGFSGTGYRESGAESGLFGIRFFEVGTGPWNRDQDLPW